MDGHAHRKRGAITDGRLLASKFLRRVANQRGRPYARLLYDSGIRNEAELEQFEAAQMDSKQDIAVTSIAVQTDSSADSNGSNIVLTPRSPEAQPVFNPVS